MPHARQRICSPATRADTPRGIAPAHTAIHTDAPPRSTSHKQPPIHPARAGSARQRSHRTRTHRAPRRYPTRHRTRSTAIHADTPRAIAPARTADCPTSRDGASCPAERHTSSGKRQCASVVLVGEGATPDRYALHPFCPGVLLPIGCTAPHRAPCPLSGSLLPIGHSSVRVRCPSSGAPPPSGALPPVRFTAPRRVHLCPGALLPIGRAALVHPTETTSRGSGDRARHTPWLA